jgi:AAHS family 4-hydroxybenzoate transporter-like MFS transporter
MEEVMLNNVNVGDVINRSAISPVQILVFVLGIAIALIDGYDTQTVAYALTSMAAEWNVKPQAFAPALTAGLLGLMIGGMLVGQLGDKFGRKPMVIVSTVLFGLFTLLIAYVDSVDELLWLRLFAGIGLGGVLPNITTMVADYAPEHRRRTVVMVIIGSLAAGAFLGGVLAGHVIPVLGWRAIFEIGGAASFVLAAVALLVLPESPLFLAARDPEDRRIPLILKRIAPSLVLGPNATFIAHVGREKRASVGRLFAAGRAPVTLLLWTAMFAQLIVVYLFSLWLPTLARESGNSIETSLFASALFSLGGLVGSLLLGPISEKVGPHLTLATSYLLVAVISIVLSTSGANVELLYSASFLVGIVAFGTWSALTALITKYYPPEIRATGVGYGSGIGRCGSMLSPWAVGLALTNGWKAPQILLLPIIPALVAALCIVSVSVLRRRSLDNDALLAASPASEASRS